MSAWLNVGAIQSCFMSQQQQVKHTFVIYHNLFFVCFKVSHSQSAYPV